MHWRFLSDLKWLFLPDPEGEFHFTITLDTDGEYEYSVDGKAMGNIGNGSTIALKSGQEAVISMIPAGTAYEVTETESGKDGYTTTTTGGKGSVPPLSQAVAAFENHKDTPPHNIPPQTGDTARTGLFVGLALTSLAAIGIVLLLGRRLWK